MFCILLSVEKKPGFISLKSLNEPEPIPVRQKSERISSPDWQG